MPLAIHTFYASGGDPGNLDAVFHARGAICCSPSEGGDAFRNQIRLEANIAWTARLHGMCEYITGGQDEVWCHPLPFSSGRILFLHFLEMFTSVSSPQASLFFFALHALGTSAYYLPPQVKSRDLDPYRMKAYGTGYQSLIDAGSGLTIKGDEVIYSVDVVLGGHGTRRFCASETKIFAKRTSFSGQHPAGHGLDRSLGSRACRLYHTHERD